MQASPKELKAELKSRLTKELISRGELEASTVVGFVCPEKGFTHALKKVEGKWLPTIERPEVYFPAVFERVILSNKRFVIVIGGRGSAKSVSVADLCLIDTRDTGAKTYFLREYQSAIKDSLFSLLKEEVKRLEFPEFVAIKSVFSCNDEECFSFAGLARNTQSIKSSHGFKRYSVEEAQFITTDSLQDLTPTARNKPKKGLPNEIDELSDDANVSMIFVANPGSSEDPFSKKFINPYMAEVLKNGFYEDEMHLIVMMNYTDNPWFGQSGLEIERAWDYQNLERALYDHIWLGAMNDSVENSLILAEWFDACVDAHLKLGFEPRGVKKASHDPSDMGPDSKSYVAMHGSVVLDVQEKEDGDINEGGHWAAGIAIEQGMDHFSWDCDGMGVGLSEQMSADFQGKKVTLSMFKGSETPDNPDAIYNPAVKAPVQNQRTIGDSLRNKRAQYAVELRDRCYRTYRAVVHNERYQDPDKLISFSSDITLLSKLRSEVCRMPIKSRNDGLVELYTKDEMKSKFKMASPNLFDGLMMDMRYIAVPNIPVRRPRPIRAMGRR